MFYLFLHQKLGWRQFPLLDMYLKNQKTNLKRFVRSSVVAALFIIAKIQKQINCPSIAEWIRRCEIRTHTPHAMEYYLAIKKNGILPFVATWTDLEGIMLSEISQIKIGKYMWRRKWQFTPVFLPGESQGRGSLVGCCLWGHRVRHEQRDLAAAAASLICGT